MISGPNAIVEAAKIPPLRLVLAREHGERALALVEAWVEHWRHSDPSALDLRAELGRTSTPSLVIQGELDEHATPQHARDLAAGVRTSQLWLIEDVYHMPPHEIPERFNRRVMDFIFTDQHEGSMEQHRGSDV
jgi:pimeloyl-ACP methyl ester carboxylesterase